MSRWCVCTLMSEEDVYITVRQCLGRESALKSGSTYFEDFGGSKFSFTDVFADSDAASDWGNAIYNDYINLFGNPIAKVHFKDLTECYGS